jgi:L-alanine-DL-glutamate epimerase-like enolase superfamily enzyme
MLRDIIENPIKMDKEGMMEVPQEPGLGIIMNEDAVKKYRIN